MSRQPNIQKHLERLFEYFGRNLAAAVVEGIEKSPTIKRLSRIRSSKASAPKGKKRGRRRGKAKKCAFRGCKLAAQAKGLCIKHYQRARYAKLHGGKVKARKSKAKVAKVRKVKHVKRVAPKKVVKKQVRSHHKVIKKIAPKATLKATPKAPAVKKPICSVPGCGKPAHARGLCSSHFLDSIRPKS